MKRNIIKVVSMLFLGSLLVTSCNKGGSNTNTSSDSEKGEQKKDGK